MEPDIIQLQLNKANLWLFIQKLVSLRGRVKFPIGGEASAGQARDLFER